MNIIDDTFLAEYLNPDKNLFSNLVIILYCFSTDKIVSFKIATCNEAGSLSAVPDPTTGLCNCKVCILIFFTFARKICVSLSRRQLLVTNNIFNKSILFIDKYKWCKLQSM